VRSQFGAAAQSYVTSTSHAKGDDLQRLLQLAAPAGTERMLDVATGGGHTALAFAPLVAVVTAIDLTPKMLDAASKFVAERGATNISFAVADAENMPFGDATFELVTARIAPHHFADPKAFIRESARVLVPGGLFLLDDNMAPEDDELDAFMNRFEQWRDPSHVRAYRPSEWRAWMQESGLRVIAEDPLSFKRYGFAEWTERMHMPPSNRDELERWLLAAPQRCRDHFQVVSADGRVQSLSGVFAILAGRKS
jgi:ubiquinone/menaquinone biosynthesis C-methylase UbiE